MKRIRSEKTFTTDIAEIQLIIAFGLKFMSLIF